MTKEQSYISYHNHKIAKKHFNLPKGWVLHHINPDWKKNDVERYIQWNIDDLQPMTRGDHQRLHMALAVERGDTKKYGHAITDEEKRHLSELYKGRPSPNKGNHYHKTPEAIEKTRQAHLGSHRSEESKQKMRDASKHLRTRGSTGMHWFNNGEINVFAYECPEGFVKGRIVRQHRGNQSDSVQAD